MALEEKKCVPCEGNITPLSKSDALQMAKELEGWALNDDATKIQHSYTFSNFRKALDFVNNVGEIAENEKHHPDITLGWGYVTITLQTHAVKGLHANDFIMAAKIDKI